jgi:hypothetical protein
LKLILEEFCVLSQSDWMGVPKAKLVRDTLKVLKHNKHDEMTIGYVVDLLVKDKLLEKKGSLFSLTLEGNWLYNSDYEELKELVNLKMKSKPGQR